MPMNLLYSPENRAERLIAVGRVVLAASSLLAVWLDPTQPAKFASVAYALLTSYVAYSGLLALWVSRAPVLSNRQKLWTHGFDLAFFSLFTYFTSGPAESPFIAYFVFSMVCATVRWQWRGTLWTAVAALATFLGLGFYFAEFLDDTLEVTPFVIRAVYLAVFALLLGYLGAHEERTRREMARLAAWSHPAGGGPPQALRDLLTKAGEILRVERVVAWVTEREEPWLLVAELCDGAITESRRAPGGASPVVPELDGASFLCLGSGAAQTVVFRRDDAVGNWHGQPFAPEALARLGGAPVGVLRFTGETASGLLFLFGRRDLTLDDLVLGEIVASLGAARLDQAQLLQQLRAAAAAEERARLARDLHDGALQSFSGIGMQVGAARRLADEQPKAVAQHLQELQRLVADEQRDLRFLIQELQHQPVEDGDASPLCERLRELCARIERTWGLRVELDAGGLVREPGPRLAREVYSMVREAVINAARHGHAQGVRVGVRAAGALVEVSVEDDGAGFPFRGSFSGEELRKSDLGPRSLRERAQALGGSFALESGPRGARVDIRLPVEETAA